MKKRQHSKIIDQAIVREFGGEVKERALSQVGESLEKAEMKLQQIEKLKKEVETIYYLT